MKKKTKMYNQVEMSDIVGTSPATTSRWINQNHISGISKDGQLLYDETVLERFKKARKAKRNKTSSPINSTALLQRQIAQQADEIKLLKEQLKIKDEQIKAWTNQANANNQLAMSSHQLIEEANLLKKLEMDKSGVDSDNTAPVQTTKPVSSSNSSPEHLEKYVKHTKINDDGTTTTTYTKKHWWSRFKG